MTSFNSALGTKIASGDKNNPPPDWRKERRRGKEGKATSRGQRIREKREARAPGPNDFP